MKSLLGLPRGVVWSLAAFMVFVGFNMWIMRQMEQVVGDQVYAAKPTVPALLPAGAYIPVIDPANDLLAPVRKPESPQIYLKRRPQKNSDQKEYGLPRAGAILPN